MLRRQQLALLYSSIVHADPETQHGRRVAKKKGQEKDNNSHFYTSRSSLEIRSSTALKFLTIAETLHLNLGKRPRTPSERATVFRHFWLQKTKRTRKRQQLYSLIKSGIQL